MRLTSLSTINRSTRENHELVTSHRQTIAYIYFNNIICNIFVIVHLNNWTVWEKCTTTLLQDDLWIFSCISTFVHVLINLIFSVFFHSIAVDIKKALDILLNKFRLDVASFPRNRKQYWINTASLGVTDETMACFTRAMDLKWNNYTVYPCSYHIVYIFEWRYMYFKPSIIIAYL